MGIKLVDCKGCGGSGGHSTYEDHMQDLVRHTCETCGGEGVFEIPTVETVADLRELAMERYETGGDIFIECWEKSEMQELIDEHPDDAYEWATMLMDNWHERANAARNEMF